MKKILIIIIKAYQKRISPFLPNSCCFYPSCSQYAIEAIDRYGFTKGTAVSARRILRCHPFSDGGYDPLI